MNLSHRAVRTAAITLAPLTAILAVPGYAWLSTPQYGAHQDALQKSGHVLGVSGFELRYEGLREGELPFFEPGYAIWANYPYFTLDGETYERAGVGGIIIRRHYVRPTRYLVTETVDGREVFLEQPRKSTLTIIDKKNAQGGCISNFAPRRDRAPHGVGRAACRRIRAPRARARSANRRGRCRYQTIPGYPRCD